MALGRKPQTPNVKFETGCLWPWGEGHRYYVQRFKAGAHGPGERATGAQCESRRPAGERGAIETRGKDLPKHLWPWGEGHRHSRKDGSFIEVSRLLHGALPLAFAGQTAPVHRAQ
jgi:hypothetical protein